MKKNSVKRQNFEEWARAKQGEDCGEWWTDGGCGRVWLASLRCQRNISKIKWQQKRTKRRVPSKQADIDMSCEERPRRCNLR